MDNNLTDEQVQVLNSELLDTITKADNGPLKKIAAEADDFIKVEIREEGFTRNVLDFKMKGNDDLDRVVEHDRPVIIEDMEPRSKGAVTVPFNVSGDQEFFYGNKFTVVFHQIKTPRWTKNINELRTYRMDLRKVITDNSLKDIHTEEDGSFIKLVDRIVGAPGGVGASGYQQNFIVQGGITRNTYPDIKKILERKRLNNGVFLMNRSTAKEFEKWDRAEIGGDLAMDTFREGLKGIGKATMFGVPHIFTLKDELVPDGVVYLFTQPNFLGRFYGLQDVTMYVEKKEDIISFNATETVGLTLANVAGVARVEFTGV